MEPTNDDRFDGISLSVADIRQAAADGVISETDTESLIRWAAGRPGNSYEQSGSTQSAPEQAKGFNLVTVAYYFGAMLMISACAWFLGDKWESLGSAGVLATTLVYFMIAAAIGWWLHRKGYIVGGGLLI